MALTHRGRPTGAIVHSDCGSQFRPAAFTAMIKTRGLAFSMGAVGICADDAATGILLSACPRKQQAQPHTSGTLPTSSASVAWTWAPHTSLEHSDRVLSLCCGGRVVLGCEFGGGRFLADCWERPRNGRCRAESVAGDPGDGASPRACV